jgi:MFS family permease
MAGGRSRTVIIVALGVAQILAWGSSFYLIAVVAKPMAEETGWPLAWIVGGLSLGSLISGLVSPRVGRMIEARGGRGVLGCSAVLLAVGLVVVGFAPDLPVYLAGWVIMGVGMGAGLYDPAFATLGRLFGEKARTAIAQLTLVAGFSSTVCWPLSAYLVSRFGWRGTCLSYAAIDLAVVLPLYLIALPTEERRLPSRAAPPGRAAKGPPLRLAFWLLAATMTIASVIMTVISVHLLTLMIAHGLDLAAAVALGTLLGPAQVGARVLDLALSRRRHPVWTLVASCVLVAAGLGLLMARPGLAAAGIVLYGAGSGIRSIARGTVPLALFGAEGYAGVMGRLAMPSLIGQAVAPALGGVLIERLGAPATLGLLFATATLAIVPSLLLIGCARSARPPIPPAPA